MKKTKLEIYALAICFCTMVFFVVTLGFVAWSIIEFTVPEFTVSSYDYECHQTDEAFKDCHSNTVSVEYVGKEKPEILPTGKELTAFRESSYDSIKKSKKRQALQEIVRNLIILIINMLVFLVHWKLAKTTLKSHS